MRAPEWLWEPSQLKLAERAVYASLLHYRNSVTGLAWPAIETIADDVGVSRHTVMRAIRALEGWRLIETRTRRQPGVRRRDANTYTVRTFEEMPEQIKPPDPDHVAGCDVIDQVAASDVIERPSRNDASTMSQIRSDHVAGSDRNPIEEPQEEPFVGALARVQSRNNVIPLDPREDRSRDDGPTQALGFGASPELLAERDRLWLAVHGTSAPIYPFALTSAEIAYDIANLKRKGAV